MGRLPHIVAAPLAAAAAACATGAFAGELQPHRAVYDLSLARVEPSASISTAEGRLVFEVSGNVCEGFVVNSRIVTRIADREGNMRVTDLRSSTFETMEPASFTFLNRTYIDDMRAGGVAVTLNEPKDSEMTLGRAVFPTAHTLLMLEAAREGERILEATIFDGGENADTLFDTTTFIRPVETGLAGAGRGEEAALSALEDAEALDLWRLSISYFEKGKEADGEQLPDYALSFRMLENGISYDVELDHGSFALSGSLAELELTEAADGC